MSKTAYAAYLRSWRWRLVIRPVRLWMDGKRCRTCHKRQDLQVHHPSYLWRGSWQIWREILDVITLCDDCHDGVHSQQRIAEFAD